MTAKTTTEILIVGGGISGIATAIACANEGRDVNVLERSPQFSEVGAGLQVGPNGSRALDRLGVLDQLSDKAVYPSRISVRDISTDELLTSIDLGEPFRERFGYPYMVMHRSDLLDALLAKARQHPRIQLQTGRKVEQVEIGDNYGAVICQDGSRHVGKILVGADGGLSRVREALCGPSLMECEGYVAFRGTIPMETIPQHAGEDNVVLYTGEAVHLVQYPVRGGKLYNQVAVFKSDRYDPHGDRWGWSDELEAAFGPAHDYVRSSVEHINRDFRWPLRDRRPIQTWHRNTTVLIGDAAHPMYQYLAQGACQALEDSVVLARCLSVRGRPASDALRAFVDQRLLRTARVQLTARSFGNLIHSGGIERAVRDDVFRARSPQDYSAVDWLYADQGHF